GSGNARNQGIRANDAGIGAVLIEVEQVAIKRPVRVGLAQVGHVRSEEAGQFPDGPFVRVASGRGLVSLINPNLETSSRKVNGPVFRGEAGGDAREGSDGKVVTEWLRSIGQCHGVGRGGSEQARRIKGEGGYVPGGLG